MKTANLDHIENFIQTSVQKHMADLGVLRLDKQDRIGLHQLIQDYLESPLLSDVYIKSAIFEHNDDIFIKTLRPLDIDNYAKVDLEDVFQMNKDMILAKCGIDSFDDFKVLMIDSCEFQKFREDSFPIQIVQRLFPKINIPRTALSQISKVNENLGSTYMSSKRHLLEKLEDEDESILINVINKRVENSVIVNAVKEDLHKDLYYRLFFDPKKDAPKRNDLTIKVETIDRDFFKRFCHVDMGNEDVSPSRNQFPSALQQVNTDLLKEDYGFIYCGTDNNEGCTAIYATNEFNELAGILVLGKRLLGDQKEDSPINQNAHYLKSVAVHRSFRGQGISLRLFKRAIEFAKEKHWIIVRTLSSEDGVDYIEKKFNSFVKNSGVKFVVNNKDKERAITILKGLYESEAIPMEKRWEAFQKSFFGISSKIKKTTKLKSSP